MMKIKHIIITAGVAVTIFAPEFALASTIKPICSAARCTMTSPTTPDNSPNCKTYTDSCYAGPHRIRSCDSCATGYTRTSVSTTLSGCIGTVTYYDCKSSSSGGDDDCDGTCPDCESTDWVSNGIGRQTKTTATCNRTTCKCSKTSENRCIAGYYGFGIALVGSDSSGCTRCPSQGHSELGNNTTITKCYITSGSDETGQFEYSQNCYYTE